MGRVPMFLTILIMACMFLSGVLTGKKILSDRQHPTILECEADLPRDQNCILVAIPKRVE